MAVKSVNETPPTSLNRAQINENVIAVRNTTGSTIPAGTAVYLSGYHVASGLPLITKAKADTTATRADGVTTTAIANNANGFIGSPIEMAGLNTSSASAVGAQVYLSASSAGGFVFTAPSTAGYLVQKIGIVTAKHATNGKILFLIRQGFTVGGQAVAASGVSNDSSVTGATVKDALETLDGDISAITPGIASVSEDTSPTLGGDLTMDGNKILDDVEVQGQVFNTPYAITLTTGAASISFGDGKCQTVNVDTAATLNFAVGAGDGGKAVILFATQDGGSNTLTFTGVQWEGGTAPTFTATDHAVDVFGFTTDGTNIYGQVLGKTSGAGIGA